MSTSDETPDELTPADETGRSADAETADDSEATRPDSSSASSSSTPTDEVEPTSADEAAAEAASDVELEADAELRACQDLIRGRIRLSEAALADDRVDLWSLNPAPRS